MLGTAPLTSDHANAQVEGMTDRGPAFTRVEDAIDATQFSQLHKAAL